VHPSEGQFGTENVLSILNTFPLKACSMFSEMQAALTSCGLVCIFLLDR